MKWLEQLQKEQDKQMVAVVQEALEKVMTSG